MGTKTYHFKNQGVGKAIILLMVVCVGCEPTTQPTTPAPTASTITTSDNVSFTVSAGSSAGIMLVKWSTKVTNPNPAQARVNVGILASNASNATVAADDKTIDIGPSATVEVNHEFDVPASAGNDIKKLTKHLSWNQ